MFPNNFHFGQWINCFVCVTTSRLVNFKFYTKIHWTLKNGSNSDCNLTWNRRTSSIEKCKLLVEMVKRWKRRRWNRKVAIHANRFYFRKFHGQQSNTISSKLKGFLLYFIHIIGCLSHETHENGLFHYAIRYDLMCWPVFLHIY